MVWRFFSRIDPRRLALVTGTMPVFQLTHEPTFPNPMLATEDGLLAIGGDLTQARLIEAYGRGIFPWFGEEDPILWWSPDPRMVVFPEEFKVSRSLRRTARGGRFTLTSDMAFEKVIAACADVPRAGQDGTWITAEMEGAYVDLHRAGYAHSVECWEDDRLVGGLYGVSLGACFFGESMFSLQPDASKLALWALVEQARLWEFRMIDCQIHTDHLASLGARSISREEFLRKLEDGLRAETRVGAWHLEAGILDGSSTS